MYKLLITLLAISFIIGCSTQNPNPINNGRYSYTIGPNVTDVDGNVYTSIVTNCGQTWTKENLNVSRYRNGDVIPQVTNVSQWYILTNGAWCWYNGDSGTHIGKLYNWYAVNDPRGLAPQGWHVPTNVEWNKLVKCIDQYADTVCLGCSQSATAGGAMKTAGIGLWLNPNAGATDISGFKGLPAGARNTNMESRDFGRSGYWWSSTGYDNLGLNQGLAWFRTLNYSSADVNKSADMKTSGLSVRLVKD